MSVDEPLPAPDARWEHEEHVARVLDTPRQRHSEAADALVVEALEGAYRELRNNHGRPQKDNGCPRCAVLLTVRAALRALGK